MLDFHIEFDEPEHGWIGVTLSCVSDQLFFSASHIPCYQNDDPITTLVYALFWLTRDSKEAKIHWFLEPKVYVTSFDKLPDNIRLTVYEYSKPEELLFECIAENMTRRWWLALRDLETRYSLEDYQTRWRHPFPTNAMKNLTNYFKGDSSK